MTSSADQLPVDTTAYSLSSKAPAPPERREGDRHLTLFRVGAMSVNGRRELCLIKNISEGGMMIRPYCALVEGEALTIELKTGCSVPCTVAWVRDSAVGVEFASPVDVLEILTNSSDGPRPRMPRIEVNCVATVRDGGMVHRMRVHDVSQGGVKLETAVVLTEGSDLVVTLPGLDPQPAAIRWTDGGQLGVTFNRLLPLADLVAWLQLLREQLRAA
ncbi:PilZ domain-containing protein [Sphingomonas sp.]|uniref:PilZ domain-containing protein n=1 Tax=Sphingomonas sp. TaxID=28214 RepID=UPI00286C376F|nr:PilZ domain-containing protein [Sphingomonas sp.]